MWLAWFCVDTCIYLYINTALYHSDRDYSTLLLLWIGFFHDSWGRMQVIGTPSNRPAARQDWNKCQSTRSSKILVDSDPILHDLLCYNLDIHDIYVFLNSLSMTGSTTMYLYIYIHQLVCRCYNQPFRKLQVPGLTSILQFFVKSYANKSATLIGSWWMVGKGEVWCWLVRRLKTMGLTLLKTMSVAKFLSSHRHVG